MPLSTQPYKGARDFYPEDKRLQKYMFARWRSVCESYGYEEYDAPILEPLDIYLAKSGQEIVDEQTYVFTDRGNREVVIRPEMTPTVSRMVAARRQELAYPARWYSIPNLWRYERPQRGRLREHWQLNVDIFGVKSISAELEMLNLIDSVFKAFGAKRDMFAMRLNHRELTNYFLSDYLNLEEKAQHDITKLVDRLHKMERTNFIAKVDEILSDRERASGTTEKLMAFLSATTIDELPSEVKSQASAQELKTVLDSLNKTGISNAKFDPSIMRGFDYYTGIVFEVYDTDPDNNRSMLGGGRYDGLVGLFGVDPVPTVGFGWGDVTLANFLATHNLLPKLDPETDVVVAILGDDIIYKAQDALQKLRDAGIRVSVDLSGRKIGDQLKAASKKGVSKVVIIGKDEIKQARFKLKDLDSGDEESLDLNSLVKNLMLKNQ